MLVARCFFFFRQKTAYELRISDWSSDVCSSDLQCAGVELEQLDAGRVDAIALQQQRPDDVGGREGRRGHRLADDVLEALDARALGRSEECRVGKECVSTCRSRRSPYPLKIKTITTPQIA